VLVEPNDVNDLAAGVRRLIVDRELREQLGSGARRAALASYTWRAHTRRTIERLQTVVTARPGDRPLAS
jgi:glycosyltransferase involved in cell wall biosynthesis